ncbi:hypothetical protein [Ekhidna sp.]|jgi:hypothetical protein|uniref:hypothetical protein n=1 Tax=Ekhidna sp. TaxID=2608089 RepID=UPI0032ED8A1E
MKQSLFIIATILCFSLHAQEREFDKMDFMVGDWKFNASSMNPDGTYTTNQTFYTKCKLLFNETSHKDDFYYKDQNGNMICYGTTIRTYNEGEKRWEMLWVGNGFTESTEMVGEYKDENFYFDGKGKDQRGEYLEKITFYDISDDQYKWKMDRSYDGGKTWMKNYFSYTATKTK